MCHLLYLMFRCDGDVMENLEILWKLNTAEEDLIQKKPATITNSINREFIRPVPEPELFIDPCGTGWRAGL